MVHITLSNLVPATVPVGGWTVMYKIKDSADPLVEATGSPFMSLPIEFDAPGDAGTLYEGTIQSNCTDGNLSNALAWETGCACFDDFAIAPGQTYCQKTDIIDPDITNSGYCLAISGNGAYSNFGSRIYKPGFSSATMLLAAGTPDAFIEGSMVLDYMWSNTTNSSLLGPMNRDGVWIDSNCDGVKNPLTAGQKVTIAFAYNNVGAARTVYVGLGGDNKFDLVVNDVHIATLNTINSQNFKIWHIVPVPIVVGVNYFNLIGEGDGGVNDAIAMAIYDNTPAELMAATSEAGVNLIFGSRSLRGESWDIATCDPGYSLDVSDGPGNYKCIKTTTHPCNNP